MTLQFQVKDQTLTRLDMQKVIANSENYLRAHFTLPSDYVGTITAHFKIVIDGVLTDTPIVLENYECIVPTEVIKSPYFQLSVSCLGDKYITTNEIKISVCASGVPTRILPLPNAQPNQFEEFTTMYNEVKAESQKIDLTDKTTGKTYKFSVNDGEIFLEEVV